MTTTPITSLTFRAGEPGWSRAIGGAATGTLYYLAFFMWWATGLWRVGAMGLGLAFAFTPLPPLRMIFWLLRRLGV